MCLGPQVTDILEGATVLSLPNTFFSSFPVFVTDNISNVLRTVVFLNTFGYFKVINFSFNFMLRNF